MLVKKMPYKCGTYAAGTSNGIQGDTDFPRDEDFHEFADADEAVGQETEHADDGEQHHDHVREAAAAVVAEAGADPFRTGQDVRAPSQVERYTARNTWLNTGHSQGIQMLFRP